MTFQEAFDEYKRSGHRDASTSRVYESFSRRVIAEFGSVALQAISTNMLERFVWDLDTAPRLDGRPGGLSPRSIDHFIRQIRAFFAWAKAHDYVERNMASPVKRIKHPEGREMVILSVQDTKTMLDAAVGSPIEAALWLASMAGLRRGEVLGLEWRDVDLTAGRLSIHHSFSVRPGGARLKRPKSIPSRRTLKLSADTIDLLDRVRAHQLATLGYLPDFVCSRGGSLAWPPNAFSRTFVRFLAKAGLRHMRFHDLRHTHAAHLIAAGVHIKTISVRLGHSSIVITMDLYGHLIGGVEDGAMVMLEDLFRSVEIRDLPASA